MTLVTTIKSLLLSPASTVKRDEQPIGAYWCHDCSERIAAKDTETDSPPCPSCGDAMELERSAGTASCAC
ncbi:hypothetical protein HUB97_03195 [Halorubraceae archaeon YAN]|nr:hypothetical protein [Halorubraceae archaeon YAN]